MSKFHQTTISDCKLYTSKTITVEDTYSYIKETPQEIPFTIQRIYFIYNIPENAARGGHSHFNLEQYIVPISGKFDIKLTDGLQTEIITLDSPTQGLYISPGIWRELINFSEDAICLVYASLPYDEQDYVRNFETYKGSKIINT